VGTFVRVRTTGSRTLVVPKILPAAHVLAGHRDLPTGGHLRLTGDDHGERLVVCDQGHARPAWEGRPSASHGAAYSVTRSTRLRCRPIAESVARSVWSGSHHDGVEWVRSGR